MCVDTAVQRGVAGEQRPTPLEFVVRRRLRRACGDAKEQQRGRDPWADELASLRSVQGRDVQRIWMVVETLGTPLEFSANSM
jgi:hypothetical protein